LLIFFLKDSGLVLLESQCLAWDFFLFCSALLFISVIMPVLVFLLLLRSLLARNCLFIVKLLILKVICLCFCFASIVIPFYFYFFKLTAMCSSRFLPHLILYSFLCWFGRISFCMPLWLWFNIYFILSFFFVFLFLFSWLRDFAFLFSKIRAWLLRKWVL
jgi:hypothetical protein